MKRDEIIAALAFIICISVPAGVHAQIPSAAVLIFQLGAA